MSANAPFWFLLALNCAGAAVASFGAWYIESALDRYGDAGPGGGFFVMFFISAPVLLCALANAIGLGILLASMVRQPRLQPVLHSLAVLAPWLLAIVLGALGGC